jgi:CRISPR-associated protein Csd1
MILEALYRLADQEGLMSDPDYEIKPVAWLVRVGEGGELLGIEGTHYLPDQVGKKKPKPQAKNFRVPRQPSGRSGTKAPAAFLVDNAKYVFGKSTKDKQFSGEEGSEKAGWFRRLIAECANATGDAGVAAVLRLMERVSSGEQRIDLSDDCASNELFAFIYAPDHDRLVHDRPAVRAYWKSMRTVGGGRIMAERSCLITGEPVGEVPLFPLLKKVPGGSMAGVSLVGFNNPAFWSHGWRHNENAPISRDAAEATATALNRLLHPAFPDPRPEHAGETLPLRHFRISSDTVVCFWASDQGATDFVDVFAAIFNPDDPAVVGDTYRGLWRGRAPELSDSSRFYALTITGTQGRAILRDWFESTVQDVVTHLAEYFADLEIVRNTPPPKGRELPPQLPLAALFESISVPGKKSKQDNIPASLAADFLRAALHGGRFPLAVLQRALGRFRVEIGGTKWEDLQRRDAQAALIKAILRRNLQLEVEPAMDVTIREPGYLLGRLIAVLERLQQLALGGVNASVIDRYFGAASATPQAVFPRLLKNARHHARKAADDPKHAGTVHWLDKQLVDEILANLEVQKPPRGGLHIGFPYHLSLEQQGLFVLGYHQQRHWLWLGREERERRQEEQDRSADVAATFPVNA